MRNDVLLGIASGLAVAGWCIGENVLRADPHLVSTFPDVISALAVPVVIFIFARGRHKRGSTATDVIRSGRTVALVAAVVFAVLLGCFAGFWLPKAPVPLALFAALSGFGTIAVAGCVVATLCGRLHEAA